MHTSILDFRKKITHPVLFSYALTVHVIRALTRKLKLMALYQRRKIIALLAEPQQPQSRRPKVLAIVAHITSSEEAENKEKAFPKIDKLKNTIDGLLGSFAHCELTISVSTLRNRNIVKYLPEYQAKRIHVQEEPDWNPMFVGFRIQDEFASRVDNFEWFLFVEDDILIHDSYILEKLENFNQHCGDGDVLLPNRYELWDGTKRYIDFTIEEEVAWNRLSAVEIDGVKYAEFINPHSGFYCLSQSQMKRWIKSERTWKNQVLMVGPLESAGSFCLLECFSLYKPHLSNLNFLEVRHYDTKYSKLYPETSSPYTFSAVAVAEKGMI